MNNNAYITLLSTNNYLYGCIGLMYSWKQTNSKYPFYCVVTEDITMDNIRILKEIGYNVIQDKLYIPKSYYETIQRYESTGDYETPIGNSTSDLQKNGWQYGWTKLRIFNYTQFDKLLYIDADSYVIQNLDDIFEYPNWSSICEYGLLRSNLKRLHSAFFLIEPNEQVYKDIIQLAEDNPLITHPLTHKQQLSNDYDLLNLYNSDWCDHPECFFPNYIYVDSFMLRTDNIDFLLKSFYKIRAIHLTGDKPWLEGSALVANYIEPWNLFKELYLIYIQFLNSAIKDLAERGIANLSYIN